MSNLYKESALPKKSNLNSRSGAEGSCFVCSTRISVTAPSVNSVLRNRGVRRMLGTPFHDRPIVSMKRSTTCFHLLNTAKLGSAENSGIL